MLSIITANSTVKGLIILGHVVELTLHPCTEIDLCWKNKCEFEIHEFCGFLQGLKIPLCLSHWNGYWVNGIQRSFVLYIVRGEGSAVPPRLTERVTNYRLMLKITSKHTHLNNPSPVGIISCQEKNTKIECQYVSYSDDAWGSHLCSITFINNCLILYLWDFRYSD